LVLYKNINVKLCVFTPSAVVIHINRYILQLIIIIYWTKIILQFCKWQYHWTNKYKEGTWIACVSASLSRSWTFQGTSHVN